MQDADKSRAVQEEEGARDLQKEIAAKYGPTFDSLKVRYSAYEVERIWRELSSVCKPPFFQCQQGAFMVT